MRLADGDATGAEQSLSQSVRLWNEVGGPYEAARARNDLGQAHAAIGRQDSATLEREAARTILDGLAAGPSVAPPADSPGAPAAQPASLNVFFIARVTTGR